MGAGDVFSSLGVRLAGEGLCFSGARAARGQELRMARRRSWLAAEGGGGRAGSVFTLARGRESASLVRSSAAGMSLIGCQPDGGVGGGQPSDICYCLSALSSGRGS